jgi:hypothetical protein
MGEIQELPRGVMVLLGDDEEYELLDVVNSWKKSVGPDWFAMSTPSRTPGFSCSRAGPPLLTQMHCRNTFGMPTQLLAGPPCLVVSPVCCSRSTLTPLALNLLARDLLPCTRTRLRNQVEPATGETLPLALTNAQLRRPFHLL